MLSENIKCSECKYILHLTTMCLHCVYPVISQKSNTTAKLSENSLHYTIKEMISFFIVNFLFICSNIPAAPVYVRNISHMIR